MRPVLHDAPDKLGRQAMKRRPAALRATALATGLRLRREQQGELVDVRAAGVQLRAARRDSQIDMSDPLSLRSDSRARERHAVKVEREHQTGRVPKRGCPHSN